jgi:hypothetical protein
MLANFVLREGRCRAMLGTHLSSRRGRVWSIGQSVLIVIGACIAVLIGIGFGAAYPFLFPVLFIILLGAIAASIWAPGKFIFGVFELAFFGGVVWGIAMTWGFVFSGAAINGEISILVFLGPILGIGTIISALILKPKTS